MPNALYRATVQELETVLPPRVVSRSLQEGLKQVGTTPNDLGVEELEMILKSAVYRHLQVTMPPPQAKATIGEILERLKAPPEEAPAGTPAQRADVLDELRGALKPFNLYFEWPETQKLRAQLQLLEEQQAAGVDTTPLIGSARAQLRSLRQKLQDQLVVQAEALSELQDDLKIVESLGGPKLRRLESLVQQIRDAQQRQELASAEVERAKKLALDLRKLLESNVALSTEPAADAPLDAPLNAPPTTADPVASERLKQLDIEAQTRELEELSRGYATLFSYRPELEATLSGAHAQLKRGDTVDLAALKAVLTSAQDDVRHTLSSELETTRARLEGYRQQGFDSQELAVALQVTSGVLQATLPAKADIQHLHDLERLLARRATRPQVGEESGDTQSRLASLRIRAEKLASQEVLALLEAAEHDLKRQRPVDLSAIEAHLNAARARLGTDQVAELHQLETALEGLKGLPGSGMTRLHTLLEEARQELDSGEASAALEKAWTLLGRLRATVARRLENFGPRLEAASRRFGPLAKLNTDDTTLVRRTLEHLQSQRHATFKVSPRVQLGLERSLNRVESLLDKLEQEYEAVRAITEELVAENILDELFFEDAPAPTAAASAPPATEPPPASPETRLLQRWLQGYLQDEDVLLAAAFTSQGELLGGEAGNGLREALEEAEHKVRIVGSSEALTTNEMPDGTVIAAWPHEDCRTVLLVEPQALPVILNKLRRDLPDLASLRHAHPVAR